MLYRRQRFHKIDIVFGNNLRSPTPAPSQIILPTAFCRIKADLEDVSVQYQLFVQNPAERRFVASVVGMPMVSGEGVTEEEAIAQAKAALETQLARGKFVTIQVSPVNQPHELVFPMQYAGIFADDPTFEDWMEKLALIRTEANSAADE